MNAVGSSQICNGFAVGDGQKVVRTHLRCVNMRECAKIWFIAIKPVKGRKKNIHENSKNLNLIWKHLNICLMQSFC